MQAFQIIKFYNKCMTGLALTLYSEQINNKSILILLAIEKMIASFIFSSRQ